MTVQPQVAIRLLHVLRGGGQAPLVLVDEGQDFDALYAEWCDQDDAYCDGQMDDRQWEDIESFLEKRAVTIIKPVEVQDLGDFYGLS